MKERVRCASPSCAGMFEVPPDRLGRSVRCPACGVRLTARPLAVEARLREQQERLAGETSGAALPRLSLSVLVDNVRSLWNVGSIFRTADACGVSNVVLAGITGCPPRPQIAKTALGAEDAVAWRYVADPHKGLEGLIEQGYSPVAIETSAEAVAFDAVEWPRRVCLVVGNEVVGISADVLQGCTRHVFIPMLGVKNSLNVAVAFGIVAHHVSRLLVQDAGSRAVGGVRVAP